MSSYLSGRCITACKHGKVKVKIPFFLTLKLKEDYKVYIHQRDEEFWLSASLTFPTDVGSTTVNFLVKTGFAIDCFEVTHRHGT